MAFRTIAASIAVLVRRSREAFLLSQVFVLKKGAFPAVTGTRLEEKGVFPAVTGTRLEGESEHCCRKCHLHNLRQISWRPADRRP